MVLGICGKIAAGKSEVLKILFEKGFYCIDADKIVHDLYVKDGLGTKRVAAVFGRKFLKSDGSVDRLKLRKVVFEDENKLKLLNDVIHPVVYEEIRELLCKNKNANVAIEATYFDEDFLADFVDKLVWVERPKEQIFATLIDERSFSEDLAEKAFALIDKLSDVDFVLKNEGSLKDLEKVVDSLF
ncbi:dephospho-CoA kinase [Candidatus Peregrinibacteria bacterium]|nr:dephospho-CoA kinase [Candidatus Peregrinibacteria bacterium]